MIIINQAQFYDAPPLHGYASPASGSVIVFLDGEVREFVFEANFERADTDLEVTDLTIWFDDEELEASKDEEGEFFGTDAIRVARADFVTLVDVLTHRIEVALEHAAIQARRAYGEVLRRPL